MSKKFRTVDEYLNVPARRGDPRETDKQDREVQGKRRQGKGEGTGREEEVRFFSVLMEVAGQVLINFGEQSS